MNKVYFKAAAALMIAFAWQSGHAQNTSVAVPDAKMISGSTTGQGLSSLYAPNLFDGSANVSIPIYQYNHDNQNYGISLTYNTKGIKVSEPFGPCGLHWNLNTGGPAITRVVHDLPDELYLETDSLSHADSPITVNHERYLKGKLITYAETAADKLVPNVYRDGECDQFVVSMGGAVFSLYFGEGGRVFTVPRQDIKVQPLINSGQLSFIITDPEGTRYFFTPSA